MFALSWDTGELCFCETGVSHQWVQHTTTCCGGDQGPLLTWDSLHIPSTTPMAALKGTMLEFNKKTNIDTKKLWTDGVVGSG